MNRTRVVSGNDFALDSLLIQAHGWNVSGKVYHDITSASVDGILFENIPLRIVNNLGVAIDTVYTNSLGEYSIQDLIPETYHVEIILPNGYYNVSSTDATPLNGSTSVNVTSSNIKNINFGINDNIIADANEFTTNAGATTTSVLTNDSLNDVVVNVDDINLTTTTIPSGFTLNADGTIEIADNVVSGAYEIIYQICEAGSSPANCDTALVLITIENPIIAIIDTFYTPRGSITTSIYVNDSINGNNFNFENVDLTILTTLPTDININEDGTIDIGIESSNGTYAFDYKICEVGDLLNCSEATIFITVENPLSLQNAILKGESFDNFNKLLLKYLARTEIKKVLIEKSIDGNSWNRIMDKNIEFSNNKKIAETFVDENGDIIETSNTISIHNKLPKVRIYPNPASNYFYIENIPTNSSIIMVDNLGRNQFE